MKVFDEGKISSLSEKAYEILFKEKDFYGDFRRFPQVHRGTISSNKLYAQPSNQHI